MADSPLKLQLSDAVKDAMRARDKARLSTLRLVMSDIKKVEVDERIEPDDARVLAILEKMIKQRRESIRQYREADRNELADAEQSEIDILQEFMPAALGEEEIDALIRQAISDTGAAGIPDMGKVIGQVRPKVAGRADMSAVSARVKALLAGN
ncbi:MAG: GatB/YqeY domain-containing protein [Pseudohongiellaceae bacterium]